MKDVLLGDLPDKNVGYKGTNELPTRLINIKDLTDNKQPNMQRQTIAQILSLRAALALKDVLFIKWFDLYQI
jgi:hypothetical protein